MGNSEALPGDPHMKPSHRCQVASSLAELRPLTSGARTPKWILVLGRSMILLAALLLLPIEPKLTRLAGADALVEEPKEAKTPAAVQPAATSTQEKTTPISVASNPRGESLLFEPRPSDLLSFNTRWWSVSVSPD